VEVDLDVCGGGRWNFCRRLRRESAFERADDKLSEFEGLGARIDFAGGRLPSTVILERTARSSFAGLFFCAGRGGWRLPSSDSDGGVS